MGEGLPFGTSSNSIPLPGISTGAVGQICTGEPSTLSIHRSSSLDHRSEGTFLLKCCSLFQEKEGWFGSVLLRYPWKVELGVGLINGRYDFFYAQTKQISILITTTSIYYETRPSLYTKWIYYGHKYSQGWQVRRFSSHPLGLISRGEFPTYSTRWRLRAALPVV